ncbi:hypothetical protein ACHQM5_002441 [Ranunculus cassubicifolius]
MEKIREMALAYFERNSKERKEAVQSFFKSIDIDGNGSIGINEFKIFMAKRSMTFSPDLFAELDKDGKGSLDFNEVITFYYMMNVRNLFCNCCEKYLFEEYYTCVKCFLHPRREKNFNICFSCYRSNKYVGTEHTNLLDNYVMLNSMRSNLERKQLVEQFGENDKEITAVSLDGSWTAKEITDVSLDGSWTAKEKTDVALEVTKLVAKGVLDTVGAGPVVDMCLTM